MGQSTTKRTPSAAPRVTSELLIDNTTGSRLITGPDVRRETAAETRVPVKADVAGRVGADARKAAAAPTKAMVTVGGGGEGGNGVERGKAWGR